MYEQELQKLRRDILRGVAASTQNMLNEKSKSNAVVAISLDNHVEVIKAKKVMKSNYLSKY